MKELSIDAKIALIKRIDFDKDFDALDWDDKANYCQLIGAQFLSKDNHDIIIDRYNRHRDIAEMRGKDKLFLYI